MPQTKKTKAPLAIVGTAPSRSEAPYDDGKTIIWGVGTTMVYDDVKRIDRLFEFHPRRYWGQQNVLERMNGFDGPIVMQEHTDDIPKSEPYPYDGVREMFYLPVMKENLFVTNSITWMILCALYEGYTDISLFGVHMAHETEYGYQQASCSWALGIIHGWILAGKPYSIYIADESELLTARYEYGFKEPSREMAYIQKRNKAASERRQKLETQLRDVEKQVAAINGILSEQSEIYNHLAGYK